MKAEPLVYNFKSDQGLSAPTSQNNALRKMKPLKFKNITGEIAHDVNLPLTSSTYNSST